MKISGNEKQESISGRPSCNACVLLEVLAGERTEQSRHDACRKTRSTRASSKQPERTQTSIFGWARASLQRRNSQKCPLRGDGSPCRAEMTRSARSPGKLGSLQGGTSQKCSLTRRNRAFGLRKHGKARQGRPERARNALVPEITGHFTCKTLQNKAFQAKTTTARTKKWRV